MELNTQEWKAKYHELADIQSTGEDDDFADEGYSAMSMLMAAAEILVENCVYESKVELYKSMLELETPLPKAVKPEPQNEERA